MCREGTACAGPSGWRNVRLWLEAKSEKEKAKIDLSITAGELIRKWINIKYLIHPGSYYEDDEARAQDINGFHKLDNLNHNVQERKNFISSNKTPSSEPAKNKPVRSATGRAARRR